MSTQLANHSADNLTMTSKEAPLSTAQTASIVESMLVWNVLLQEAKGEAAESLEPEEWSALISAGCCAGPATDPFTQFLPWYTLLVQFNEAKGLRRHAFSLLICVGAKVQTQECRGG